MKLKDQPPKRMFPKTNIVHHFHPIAWVTQMKRVFGDNGICICEARVRAYMRMLRVGEGTEKEIGYTTQYSGKQFSDMSKHPEEVITAGNYSSSAAGAYQIMRYTWWWLKGEKLTKNNKKAGVYEKWHDYIKKYNIPNFNQESQDLLCLIIFKHKRKGMLDLIIKGKIKEATEKHGSHEWASLPPGQYGQPTQTMEKALKKYKEYLKDELNGQSNLHLKKGFLKEFGFDCCNDSISNDDEIKNGVSLHFTGVTSSESALSTKTKNILKEVGKETKNLNIYITSTARTPYEQARIMYKNIVKSSVSSQKEIYASAGDKVIDVYTSQIKLGKSKNDIIKEMEKKIKEIGPSKVSKHLADPEVMNTFDVDYGLLSNKNDFWNGMKKRTELDTILKENKCYHVQINQ